MMICTTNDGPCATNGTGMCEPSQQFGGKDHFMATAKAFVAPVAAMISGYPKNCCVESQEVVSLVSYEHSLVVYVSMPIT